jgi:hypothetical protein
MANKVIGSFSVVSHHVEHLVNLARVPKSENHSKSALFLPVFLQIVVIDGFLLLHARLRARLRRGTPAEYNAVEPQCSMGPFRRFESGWQCFVRGRVRGARVA